MRSGVRSPPTHPLKRGGWKEEAWRSYWEWPRMAMGVPIAILPVEVVGRSGLLIPSPTQRHRWDGRCWVNKQHGAPPPRVREPLSSREGLLNWHPISPGANGVPQGAGLLWWFSNMEKCRFHRRRGVGENADLWRELPSTVENGWEIKNRLINGNGRGVRLGVFEIWILGIECRSTSLEEMPMNYEAI